MVASSSDVFDTFSLHAVTIGCLAAENFPLTINSTGTATARRKANPNGNSGTAAAVIWNVVVVATWLNTGEPPLGS